MKAIQAGSVLPPLASFASGTVLIEGEKIAAVGQVGYHAEQEGCFLLRPRRLIATLRA